MTNSCCFKLNRSVLSVITRIVIDAAFIWNHIIWTQNDSFRAQAVIWGLAVLFHSFQINPWEEVLLWSHKSFSQSSDSPGTFLTFALTVLLLGMFFLSWLAAFLLVGFYFSVTSLERGFLTNPSNLYYIVAYVITLYIYFSFSSLSLHCYMISEMAETKEVLFPSASSEPGIRPDN